MTFCGADSGQRPARDFLSPLDALHIVRPDIAKHVGSYAGSLRSVQLRADSYNQQYHHYWPVATAYPSSSSPLPPSTSSSSSRPSYISQGLPLTKSYLCSSRDLLEQQLGHTDASTRRYSDQDLRTRLARANLPVQKHKRSAASYPIFSPTTNIQPYCSNSTQSLPWQLASTMESLRFASQPSSTSSATTKLSFESRQKSPLSTSSSIDYNDSRISEDSSSINSYNGKPDFAPTRAPVPPKVTAGWQQRGPESTYSSAWTRYGGGAARQQNQTTLLTPRRIRQPSTIVSPVSSRDYSFSSPGEGFCSLPEEILFVILTELKTSHVEFGSLSCSTCWMRELVNLGLSCKKWWGAASSMLYEDIHLIGKDSIIHTKKKFKMKYGTRLKLLRRTLRSRPDLAQYVKSLKVPAIPDAAKSGPKPETYLDLVASVIMACPNIERLPGFYPTYSHEFSRFFHAISTRKKLIEAVWVIDPTSVQRQHSHDQLEEESCNSTPLAPSLMLPEHQIGFLDFHSNWANLQTLCLQCNPGGAVDSSVLQDVFRSLPKLEHLHVSSFPARSFNDATLLSIPKIRSLRLENLTGITCEGLSSFAAPRRADRLKSLSLISIPLLSLPVLARIFSHLTSLERLAISQAPSPCLPPGESIFLHPYLASSTLEYLHWELTNSDDDMATTILAKAIQFGGFPSLRTLRAPTDFDGVLQALCKPRERIELPGDRYRNLGIPGHISLPPSQSMPNMPCPTRSNFVNEPPSITSPTRSKFSFGQRADVSAKSPARSTFSLSGVDKRSNSISSHSFSDDGLGLCVREKGMSLATSRRMAQQRIEAAITQPRFQIIVWDEEGSLQERFAVAGFIGELRSGIFYSLKPDVHGSDEAIFSMKNLLEDGDEVTVRDGCTGSWASETGDMRKGAGRDGKGKENWWHTERSRWRELPLETLF